MSAYMCKASLSTEPDNRVWPQDQTLTDGKEIKGLESACMKFRKLMTCNQWYTLIDWLKEDEWPEIIKKEKVYVILKEFFVNCFFFMIDRNS